MLHKEVVIDLGVEVMSTLAAWWWLLLGPKFMPVLKLLVKMVAAAAAVAVERLGCYYLCYVVEGEGTRIIHF